MVVAGGNSRWAAARHVLVAWWAVLLGAAFTAARRGPGLAERVWRVAAFGSPVVLVFLLVFGHETIVGGGES
jgi:hypothetical protein